MAKSCHSRWPIILQHQFIGENNVIATPNNMRSDENQCNRVNSQQYEPREYYFVNDNQEQSNSRYITEDDLRNAQAQLEEDLREDLRARGYLESQVYRPRLVTNRQNLFQRSRGGGEYEYSGNWRNDDDEDYFQEEVSEEYGAPETELNAVDRETIATNEEEIYRVKTEIEYDERRIERMERKMKAMERTIVKMQDIIDTKYPFGGYYKK